MVRPSNQDADHHDHRRRAVGEHKAAERERHRDDESGNGWMTIGAYPPREDESSREDSGLSIFPGRFGLSNSEPMTSAKVARQWSRSRIARPTPAATGHAFCTNRRRTLARWDCREATPRAADSARPLPLRQAWRKSTPTVLDRWLRSEFIVLLRIEGSLHALRQFAANSIKRLRNGTHRSSHFSAIAPTELPP